MILNHIIKTKEVDEMIKGVKHLRVKAGYDTDEAAEILDITKSTLYKIEQGHLNPSLKLLDRMRKHISVHQTKYWIRYI
jgi:putative transcriptional regulator